MTEPRGRVTVAALLSFNGGFVDTVSFLGLSGLFASHVTGNFVTLGATLVLGSHGILNKVLALPEFIAVIALARLLGGIARKRGTPSGMPLSHRAYRPAPGTSCGPCSTTPTAIRGASRAWNASQCTAACPSGL